MPQQVFRVRDEPLPVGTKGPFASTQTQATTMSRSPVCKTGLRDIVVASYFIPPQAYP